MHKPTLGFGYGTNTMALMMSQKLMNKSNTNVSTTAGKTRGQPVKKKKPLFNHFRL